MFKKVKAVAKLGKKSGLFVGGVVFGTAGLKLLGSKEAKKGYAYVVAKGMKIKDELDQMISTVKQHSDDVYAQAQDMYQADVQKNTFETLAELDDKNEDPTGEV